MAQTQPERYNVYLDYKGYLIDPRSYRVFPAPLMGTKFATGRTAYSSLDFWQVGAMTDFTHGINQEFLVDPSAYYLANGLDMSQEGEFKLERDLQDQAFSFSGAYVTARYRSRTTLYLGLSSGKLVKTTNGTSFSVEQDTGAGKIYAIYEMKDKLFVTKGSGQIWVKDSDGWSTQCVDQDFSTTSGSVAYSIYGSLKLAQSIQVNSSQEDAYYSLKSYLSKLGTVANDLTIRLETETDGAPSGTLADADAVWTVPKGELADAFAWIKKNATAKFSLTKSTTYWLVFQTSGGDASNCIKIGTQQGARALYENGNKATYDGAAWTNVSADDVLFQLYRDTESDLYYVMIESDYAYGVFSDGVRQSLDGNYWVPEPPDPLWELPNSEGAALNAQPIQRGFLIGAERGCWIFIGGGSAVNLWMFPEYSSANNFRGMEKFGPYGLFSIENQGIFYTDGSGIFRTNLNWQEAGIKITSCKSILASGWDIFALVSDGSDWYLARCNMKNSRVPRYWWFVKKLTKEPQYLSCFNRSKVYIHNLDGTCYKYDKVSGPYQTTGYLKTSWVDENLILLQKLYKSLSLIFKNFPSDTTATLAYKLKEGGAEVSCSVFTGDGSDLDHSSDLANPTLSTRIQIKATLASTNTTKTPTVTDLLWKYVLERPVDEAKRKKLFSFSILAEDELEKIDFDKEELGLETARSRQDVLDGIWDSRDKQELLNFVGADNENSKAFTLRYIGTGSACLLKIDKTNHTLSTTVDGVGDISYSYKDKLISTVVTYLNGLGDYQCLIDPEVVSTRTANGLFPVDAVEIKGETIVYWGTDVRSVIWNQTAPSQFKLGIEGRGSDRLQITLREV